MADDLVTVPVPRKHLAKVYGFIAQLEQEGEIGAKPLGVHEWTPELVTRAYSDSAKTMKRILREMADHAEQELSTADLARAMKADADWNNVAGALGAFGRRVKTRYAMAGPPFEVGTDDEGRTYYSMPERIASVIREQPDPWRGTRVSIK